MEPQHVRGDDAEGDLSGTSSSAAWSAPSLRPQHGDESCPTCGGRSEPAPGTSSAPRYVYALGRIEPRFPSIGVEKELAQAAGRADTAGLTDRETLHKVLQQNRYLVRQLCWVFTIAGLDTYLLQPRDPADFQLLADSYRRRANPLDIDSVVGLLGPIAPPDMCNGLMVPIVGFDQLYAFSREELLTAAAPPDPPADEQFERAAEEVLDRIMQMADNAGATDEHRALNYLVLRYRTIFERTLERYSQDASLTAVDVRPSTLSTTRRIMSVIFSYTNRNTDVVEKFAARVDVTEEFPFLVTKMSPYFDW